MAKKPKSQINRNNQRTIKNLVNLMNDLGQKYSIRVGIIGNKAREIHENSTETNAEIGAKHEFGAIIRDSLFGKTYEIPARSFLRMPLLGAEGKKVITKEVLNDEYISQYKEYLEGYNKTNKGGDKQNREYNDVYRKAIAEIIKKLVDSDTLMEAIATKTGMVALARVQEAFDTGGFGNWAPITEFTKEHRIKDKTSPPLTDTSQLRDSITFEVKKVN